LTPRRPRRHDAPSQERGFTVPQRIIDLSLLVEDNMPAHKLFQRPVLTTHLSHESSLALGLGVPGDAMTFQTNFIATLDHVGTHVDAFRHTNPHGAAIADMPLDLFIGRAVCFDLRHIGDLEDITAEHMQAAEDAAGVTVDGHIVLLCTGFHNRTYPTLDSVWKNPGLTVAATRWLHARGSRMHGVEGPSTDKPSDNIFAQHRLCRDLGISHFEWLVNLESLIGKGEFQFFGAPLKIKGGSGSPVRAFAILNE
jgi:kynurenine formamidase